MIRPAAPSPGFVRAVLDGHSALGLVAAALLYLVCASGTLSVFGDALQNWEQPSAHPVEALAPEDVDRAMQQALTKAGGPDKIFALLATLPGDMQPRLTVTTYGGDSPGFLVDGAGTLQKRRTSWTDFILDLHMTLTLPAPWGGGLVGLAGVALLALIVTGLLAHPRIFKDAFAFRALRSRRLRETDLHNRLSVWGLPFHISIAATGALFGLGTLIAMGLTTLVYHGDASRVGAGLAGPTLTANPALLPTPPLAQMLTALGPGEHQASFVYIERPGTVGQKITVETRAPRRLTHGERYFFDGTAKLLGSGGYAEGSLGPQIYGAAAGLHFGNYGGLPVQLVYGLLGLALSTVAAGGVAIWLIRRRDRGRPLPYFERVWTGIVWGVPLGFAWSAARVAATGSSPAWSFWGGLFFAIAIALGPRQPETASRILRGGIVGLLGLLVAGNSLRFGALAWSGGALVCNLLWLAGILAIIPGLKPIRTLRLIRRSGVL